MTNPSSFVPTLTDGVVTLRRHSVGDVDAMVEQCRDPEMQRWTTVPRNYSRDDALARVELSQQAWADPIGDRQWVIELAGDAGPTFAGLLALRPGESPTTSWLGFSLHPAARGRGLMTRAMRLVATYAFTAEPWGHPVTRLHWRADVGNWGSRRVAWATGFTFHGTLPQTHMNPADPTGPALDSWHASLGPDDTMTAQTRWLTPIVIEEDGIRLRPWRDGDVDAIEPRDDDPVHWMPADSVLRPETFSAWRHKRQVLMAEGSAVEWCVADAASDRAVGAVAVFNRGAPIGDVAELGYQFFPSARGRGAAKTGARLAIRHALTPTSEGGLGVRRMVAGTAADNAASNGVLAANGFVVFGREQHVDELDDLADGGWGDDLHWQLLPGADPPAPR